MELRKSKRRDSLERLCLNKNKSKKSIKVFGLNCQRKYIFKYYPDTGKFIKTIS